MRTIEALIGAIHQEALREPFPIDTPVYEQAGKDPSFPILYAGTLEAPVCVFARDLGSTEVVEGQPLIGAGGRLVRTGFYEAMTGNLPPRSDQKIESVLSQVLLTNTVPYKPPGNKAYINRVKQRFRPFLAELLGAHWKGNHLITLGTEAFQWFAPYADPAEFKEFWARDDRYEASLNCQLSPGPNSAQDSLKAITLLPLPHPSPLNQKWYKEFPKLLAARIASLPT